MAMVQCPECNKEMSDSSEVCPNCGYRNKRSLSVLLGIAILFLPFFFSWFVLRKGYSKIVRVIVFGYLILITVAMMGNISNMNEEIAKKQAYFDAHKDEIVREVKEHYDKGHYSSAIITIDKYTFSDEPNLAFSEYEDKARKIIAKAKKEQDEKKAKAEIENKKNAPKIAAEKLKRETYAPGGLDKSWSMRRQCFAVTMQDTTGIHTIERNQAISKNYVAELTTTNKKINAKMLWSGKSYDGSYQKVDKMEGFSNTDDDIFNRVYVSLFGGAQINIWITEEEVFRDDFSSYPKIVHYLQVWDTAEGLKLIFECPQQ